MIKKLIKILTIILAVILIAYIAFLKMPKASVGSQKAAATVLVDDIYTAFSDDEKTANTQYLGKVVVLSGDIDDKYTDENGSTVLILRGASGDPGALVTMEPGQSSELNKYDIDQPISVKAICTGMLMEVTFNKGVIQK